MYLDPKISSRRCRWPVVVVLLAVVLVAGSSTWAGAHDGSNTPRFGIVTDGDVFLPIGGMEDHPWNGFKVFLSSPRHASSGDKGECNNPGREENVNGRYWNWMAANGSWYGGSLQPDNPQRNLHGRGYRVYVSPNTRDNDYENNRTRSENWGSDLHIVTHTNGTTTPPPNCAGHGSYLETLWEHQNGPFDDRQLATAIGQALKPEVPSESNWRNNQDSGLWELETNAPRGDAYVELQHHDNQSTHTWIYNHTEDKAYLYGLAVDGYLNYP